MERKRFIATIVSLLVITSLVVYFYQLRAIPSHSPVTIDSPLPSPTNTIPAITPAVATTIITSVESLGTEPFTKTELADVLELGIQAKDLYKAQKYKEAIALLTKAISLDPFVAVLYVDRGVNYQALGNFDFALADYEQALRVDRQSAHAFYNRGRLLFIQGQYTAAIADFEQAIKHEETLKYSSYSNIALSYYEQEQYNLALEAIDKAIEFAPTKLTAYRIRGDINLVLKNYEAAKSDFQTAVEKRSNYGRALVGLGKTHYGLQNYEQALATLSGVTQQGSRDPSAWFYLGASQLILDNTKSEIEQTYKIGITLSTQSDYLQKRVTLRQAVIELEQIKADFPDKADQIEILITWLKEAM